MSPLRELLIAMTAPTPPESVVDEFVTFCRKTAVVLVRKKVATGRLSLNHVSLSADDLALDAIADLFSRNPEGKFVQLDAYLRGIDVCSAPEAELTSHIRRLVFAKVNQGIFRVYHEIDPSLSRIIRNIKVSINTLRNFDVVERFGEQFIKPAACDSLEHLPAIDPSVLTHELGNAGSPAETVPGLLSRLCRCLREREDCCRLVPLVQVAILFRSLYAGSPEDESAAVAPEPAVSVADATEVIARACLWVRERAHRKYVGSGKVEPEVFDRYFVVLEETLVAAIVETDGEELRYYDGLKKLMPGLSREEYRAEHKSKIEYLGRIARRRAVKELKKIF